MEKGNLFWNGFVFQVGGFGCLHNQVLSTCAKTAPCTKIQREECIAERSVEIHCTKASVIT